MLLSLYMGRKKLNSAIVGQVINNVAKGKTTNQVLSVVPSISAMSVERIKKNHQAVIQAKKEKYIKLIDRFSGGDIKQAEVLADTMKAEQDVFNFRGQVVGRRPDYKTRLNTIKYLDRLKGREMPNVKLSQTNNYIGHELDRYLK